MNKQESDILNALLLEPFINQRVLAEVSGHSLGVVNRSLKELIKAGYLNEAICPTAKVVAEYKNKTPKQAIILAAGFGMRMVPINTEMPKGLLEVNGEPLIERIIKQLHEVGIQEIYVVVGFMKEKYEYLMDEYGVELVVSPDYASKNNLHSLRLVKEHLENAYIVPCDIWCDRNPFHRHELYSWYMVSDLVENESNVRVNRKMELVTVPENVGGNAMIGISYLTKEDSDTVSARIEELCKKPQYDGSFWEEALYNKDRMIVTARVVHSADVVEINTYEQLREIDSDSNQLETEIPYDTAKLVGTNCAGFDVYGDRYPKSCYESFIYMNFEGHKLRGSVGYDEILTKQYGDYMTPPPVEKQVTHHSNKVYVHNVN